MNRNRNMDRIGYDRIGWNRIFNICLLIAVRGRDGICCSSADQKSMRK